MSKKKWALSLIVLSLLPMGLVFVMLVTILGLIGEYNNTAGQVCTPPANGLPVTYNGPAVGNLTPMQMSRAAAVVQSGREMGISDRGIVVALATASQESGFKVYANDGKGNDLNPDQKGIAASMKSPHDAVGTDHGSIGLFQQQWPWWGTMPELMDPATSARKFYGALVKVKGWESLPVTEAAQRVQRSAYPDAYADDETLAEQLLTTIDENGSSDDVAKPARGSRGGSESIANRADCVMPAGMDGEVVFPLSRDSFYVDQHNFGQTGGRWSDMHTGNDYSAACGTPVFAATSGTVEFDESHEPWAGQTFMRISTGPGKLATWYAHMETRTVQEGQQVQAGQQIGTVGDLGNSSGCHLHFEVHPSGGGIYDDPVDPVAWFVSHIGRGIGLTFPALPAERERSIDGP